MEKDTYSKSTLQSWIDKIEKTPNGESICPKCETVFDDKYDGCYCLE